MGKKSKSGKDKPSAASIAKGEEELLEKAVAENKAAREKEIADGCPTKAELLAALDQITLFDLRVMENGKGTQTCLSPEGDYIFYVDFNDAAEALQARKMTHAGHLVLGTTPLGKVFGLTEADAFGFQSNVAFPMYLQGSNAVIDDLVRDGLDEGAKSLCPVSSQLNPKSSTVPMFSFPGDDDGALFLHQGGPGAPLDDEHGQDARGAPAAPHHDRPPRAHPSNDDRACRLENDPDRAADEHRRVPRRR